MNPFKDNFSKQAGIYAKFRPAYPIALFDYLQGLTTEHDLAWDCGTGNGQSAVQLACFYDKVYATDPSEEQIKHAFQNDKVTYKVEKAEQPGLHTNSTDLVTVAQAIHWFDFDLFYPEVRRVLKPGGIIAAWAYSFPVINPDIDPVIKDFHDNIVGKFWLPENKLIDLEYKTIPFPFEEVQSPAFYIKSSETLADLIGYIRSWSATQKYIDHYKEDPVIALQQHLLKYWKEKTLKREASRRLILRIGRKTY